MQVWPLFCLCIAVGQAAGTGTPQDPTGSRAVALQQKIDAAITAGESAVIPLSGVYNFSDSSLHLEGCDGLSLLGDGEATTTLTFYYHIRTGERRTVCNARLSLLLGLKRRGVMNERMAKRWGKLFILRRTHTYAWQLSHIDSCVRSRGVQILL